MMETHTKQGETQERSHHCCEAYRHEKSQCVEADGIRCVWEHHGSDTLLYAVDYPGAFARGRSLEEAKGKMVQEICSYAAWLEIDAPHTGKVEVIQDASCELEVREADSDVLFQQERATLTMVEYRRLKAAVLKSAADFLTLYEAVPNKDSFASAPRNTFYGPVPRTAREMYLHTKNVNTYYFGEIEVASDNEGTILECRRRGLQALEKQPNFLENPVVEGSYGELWTLRKVLRRFLWHDRIHAKAMYRMALRLWGDDEIPNPFAFQ